MSKEQYEELVRQREALKKLLEGPVSVKQHRVELEKQLEDVRSSIKNAHREQNKQMWNGR